MTLPAVIDWWTTEITFRDDFSCYVNSRGERGPHEVPAHSAERDPSSSLQIAPIETAVL